MKKFFNWKLALILILILAAFLRFWQLGKIPYGSTDDETFFIYDSYSIWNTGKDINGVFFPLSFNAHSLSPVPIYFSSPLVGLLGISLFSGRLLSAILGIGSVILIFLLTDYFFKNKWIAIIAGFILAISPWALQLQRTGLEPNYPLFFYLLGIYIFVTNIKNSKFLWSLIPFALGFYSYHATKVFFLFLMFVVFFIFRKELLAKKKLFIVFFAGIIILFFSFSVVIKTQNVKRQSEVSLINSIESTKVVNWERTYNTAPQIIRTIFSNKPLYYLRMIRENYLESFSINFLFLYGETRERSQINNIFFRGEFYIIELLFLIFGIYVLFIDKKYKFQRNLLLCLVLISAMPSAFTIDKNFANRNILLLPFLIIIMSLGMYSLIYKISSFKKIYKYILFISISFLYLFLFCEYFYQYYFRWSVYGAEAWNLSSRDLTYYIAKNKNKYDKIIVSNSGKNFLIQYATFEKIDPRIVQEIWNKTPIKLDNIIMLDSCLLSSSKDIKSILPHKTLYIASFANCKYDSTPSAKIVDKGEPLHTIWNIYEKD